MYFLIVRSRVDSLVKINTSFEEETKKYINYINLRRFTLITLIAIDHNIIHMCEWKSITTKLF